MAESPPIANQDGPSNGELIGGLFGVAWRYRLRCVQVLSIQLVLLTMGIFGLGFTGIGIDYMRRKRQAPGAGVPQAPAGWFLKRIPADWPPMQVLGLLAGFILLLAVCR